MACNCRYSNCPRNGRFENLSRWLALNKYRNPHSHNRNRIYSVPGSNSYGHRF